MMYKTISITAEQLVALNHAIEIRKEYLQAFEKELQSRQENRAYDYCLKQRCDLTAIVDAIADAQWHRK